MAVATAETAISVEPRETDSTGASYGTSGASLGTCWSACKPATASWIESELSNWLVDTSLDCSFIVLDVENGRIGRDSHGGWAKNHAAWAKINVSEKSLPILRALLMTGESARNPHKGWKILSNLFYFFLIRLTLRLTFDNSSKSALFSARRKRGRKNWPIFPSRGGSRRQHQSTTKASVQKTSQSSSS